MTTEQRKPYTNKRGEITMTKQQKEEFTMWFQDGGGRTAIWGRRELRRYAKQYDFDADKVIKEGEIEMLDEFGEIVGGVYLAWEI